MKVVVLMAVFILCQISSGYSGYVNYPCNSGEVYYTCNDYCKWGCNLNREVCLEQCKLGCGCGRKVLIHTESAACVQLQICRK